VVEKELEIPRNSSTSSLIHKQVAIKFGKRFDADMPSYRESVMKLGSGTHAHVGSNIK